MWRRLRGSQSIELRVHNSSSIEGLGIFLLCPLSCCRQSPGTAVTALQTIAFRQRQRVGIDHMIGALRSTFSLKASLWTKKELMSTFSLQVTTILMHHKERVFKHRSYHLLSQTYHLLLFISYDSWSLRLSFVGVAGTKSSVVTEHIWPWCDHVEALCAHQTQNVGLAWTIFKEQKPRTSKA